MKVINSLGKATCFQKIKQQKDKEFEKTTDESETGFNLDKHIFYAYIYNAGNYIIKWLFDSLVSEKMLECWSWKTRSGHGKGHRKSWNFKIFNECKPCCTNHPTMQFEP